jgi:hypothetical protein
MQQVAENTGPWPSLKNDARTTIEMKYTARAANDGKGTAKCHPRECTNRVGQCSGMSLERDGVVIRPSL